MGYLLLEGGAEFGGAMREPDLRAIDLAGGFDAPIQILPTAAAPDNNHVRAGSNGLKWFQKLGAKNANVLPLTDRASTDLREITDPLREAKLIYMLGGSPHHLGQTLKESLAWAAVLEAYQAGAVIAGSSAGAMVLCEHYFDPARREVEQGLNLVPNSCVLPHYNTFGKGWAGKLSSLLPGVTLLGIDEQTGMLTSDANWQVLGGGEVTVYRGEEVEVFVSEQRFMLD